MTFDLRAKHAQPCAALNILLCLADALKKGNKRLLACKLGCGVLKPPSCSLMPSCRDWRRISHSHKPVCRSHLVITA